MPAYNNQFLMETVIFLLEHSTTIMVSTAVFVVLSLLTAAMQKDSNKIHKESMQVSCVSLVFYLNLFL